MAIKIIGAGFPRTGTTTLKRSLEILEIHLSGAPHNNEPIYNGPNSHATTSKQFTNAHSCISNNEAVDSQLPTKYRNDKRSCRGLQVQ